MRTRTIIVLILIILIVVGSLLAVKLANNSQPATSSAIAINPGGIIFSENFESYTDPGRTSNIGVKGVDPTVPWVPANGAPGNFIADGRVNNNSTLPWGPPHTTSTYYRAWRVAGGNGSSSGCNPTAEPCTYWVNQGEGENSIVALSMDEAHSGSYSLEVGDGDTYNKIEAAFDVLASLFPTTGIVTYKFWIWISPGLYNGGTNGKEQICFDNLQGRMEYAFATGTWQLSEGAINFTTIGTDRLSAQTWHSIEVQVNMGTHMVNAVLVDGSSSWETVNVQTLDAWNSYGGTSGNAIPYGGSPAYTFTYFDDQKLGPYNQGACSKGCSSPMESVYSAGLSGASYFFLDDIQLSVLPSGLTSTTSQPTMNQYTTIQPTTSQFTSTTATAGGTVWSANFETGSQSQFDGTTYNTCTPGSIGVTKTIVHSGTYAGNYSGTSGGAANCREYVTNDLPYKLTDFYFSGWFYLPTSTISNWVSLATFSTSVNWNYVMTVDASGSDRQLYIFTNDGAGTFYQTGTPVAFPFNTWFHLELYAHGIGTSNATANLYEDGQPIVQASGDLMAGAMDSVHFGLYVESTSIVTILNDDLSIINLSSSSTGVTTTSVTSSTATTPVTELPSDQMILIAVILLNSLLIYQRYCRRRTRTRTA